MEQFILWPTAYDRVTQKWGERPDFYARFGLPHHEGMDIRALNGSPLFAGVDGIVSEAGFRKGNLRHAYGYAFRLQFPMYDGEYELVYAHGIKGSSRFNKGDVVKQGQVIMLADSTGNVQGAHLHLSLKKLVVNKSASRKPNWVRSELDYFVLSNGEAMIDPEPWLIPFSDSQKIIRGRLE